MFYLERRQFLVPWSAVPERHQAGTLSQIQCSWQNKYRLNPWQYRQEKDREAKVEAELKAELKEKLQNDAKTDEAASDSAAVKQESKKSSGDK